MLVAWGQQSTDALFRMRGLGLFVDLSANRHKMMQKSEAVYAPTD